MHSVHTPLHILRHRLLLLTVMSFWGELLRVTYKINTSYNQNWCTMLQALAQLRDIPAAAVAVYLSDCHRASLTPLPQKHSCFAEHLIRLTKTVRNNLSVYKIGVDFLLCFPGKSPEQRLFTHFV